MMLIEQWFLGKYYTVNKDAMKWNESELSHGFVYVDVFEVMTLIFVRIIDDI